MKFFYKGMELEVPESVYYPHDDSILLAEVAEKQRLEGKKALDICCGSGLTGIIMAKHGAIVTAADINEDAVEITRANAAKNGVRLGAVRSDLFSSVTGRFDFIACNPPYLPEKDSIMKKLKGDYTSWYGGETGREVIEKLVPQARERLNKNGKLFLLISSLTGENEVLELLDAYGFKTAIAARKKIPWEELMVIEAH